MNAGQIASLFWDLLAWGFLASVIAAPFVALIQKARARGKRIFVDEPTARVRALHQDTTNSHIWDA